MSLTNVVSDKIGEWQETSFGRRFRGKKFVTSEAVYQPL
jgi:hypothetical protein